MQYSLHLIIVIFSPVGKCWSISLIRQINNGGHVGGRYSKTKRQKTNSGWRLRCSGKLPRNWCHKSDHSRCSQKTVHGLRSAHQGMLRAPVDQSVIICSILHSIEFLFVWNVFQTNLPIFKVKESSVRRRYSDFEWLRSELERDSKVKIAYTIIPSRCISQTSTF